MNEHISPITSTSKSFLDPTEYSVGDTGLTQYCCVGIVDMAESTRTSAHMLTSQQGRYYEIVLNSLSKELYEFGGFVIKNLGDGLLFYFSNPPGLKQNNSIRTCIDCCISLIKSRDKICAKLNKENLPRLDFRISLDYGRVLLMKANNSTSVDIIGPPVNMSAKINSLASQNSIIIGGDFYQMVKKFKDLRFKQVKGYSVDTLMSEYPAYQVTKKD